MTIPKNIFFTCKDKNNIHYEFKNNIEYIKAKNPEYKCQIIDNDDFENLLKEKNIEWYNCYKKLNKKYGAMIGDYVRYCLLYFYGGVYMDLKSRTKKPLREIIRPEDIGILSWWCLGQKNLGEWGNGEIQNFLLIFQKEDDFIKYLIEDINLNILTYNRKIHFKGRSGLQSVLHFTGPRLLTKKFLEYAHKDNYRLLEQKERRTFYQYTICGNNTNHRGLYKDKHYSKFREDLVIQNQ